MSSSMKRRDRTRSFTTLPYPRTQHCTRVLCMETYGEMMMMVVCDLCVYPQVSILQSIKGAAAGLIDYASAASAGAMVAEPVESVVWVNAWCANLNWQSLLTLCSNVLSIPPFVRPSANMSLVSTQCIRLIMSWVRRSRTDIRCKFKLHL